MLFKAFCGTAVFLGTIAWLGYSLVATEPCERMDRLALPIRLTMDATRFIASNLFAGPEHTELRLSLLELSIKVDSGAQTYASAVLYGPSLTCKNFL
jgi:hypothetical protein